MRYLDVNIHEFFGKAAHNLRQRWASNRITFVNTNELTERFRKFREVKIGEEQLGDQAMFRGQKGEYMVLSKSIRDKYWNMPEGNTVSLVQLAIWYKTTKDLDWQQANLDKRLVDGLPMYIALRDRTTVLKKNRKKSHSATKQ